FAGRGDVFTGVELKLTTIGARHSNSNDKHDDRGRPSQKIHPATSLESPRHRAARIACFACGLEANGTRSLSVRTVLSLSPSTPRTGCRSGAVRRQRSLRLILRT